jgi:hypothetical protein
MENAAFVSVMNRVCDRCHQLRGPARLRVKIGDAFAQSASAHEAHAVKRRPVYLAGFVDGKNMRMIEAGYRLPFSAKSFQHSRGCGLLGQNHFDGHLTLRAVLHRAIDHAHSPTSNLLDQIVSKGTVVWQGLFRQRRVD